MTIFPSTALVLKLWHEAFVPLWIVTWLQHMFTYFTHHFMANRMREREHVIGCCLTWSHSGESFPIQWRHFQQSVRASPLLGSASWRWTSVQFLCLSLRRPWHLMTGLDRCSWRRWASSRDPEWERSHVRESWTFKLIAGMWSRLPQQQAICRSPKQ